MLGTDFVVQMRPSARGKTFRKTHSACVVEKITSTKNSAVGQPIRELHTLDYLLLVAGMQPVGRYET